MPLPVSLSTRGANDAFHPCRFADRAHRLADEDGDVGGRDRLARRDRQLELALGVLGMELLQVEALRLDRL